MKMVCHEGNKKPFQMEFFHEADRGYAKKRENHSVLETTDHGDSRDTQYGKTDEAPMFALLISFTSPSKEHWFYI